MDAPQMHLLVTSAPGFLNLVSQVRFLPGAPKYLHMALFLFRIPIAADEMPTF